MTSSTDRKYMSYCTVVRERPSYGHGVKRTEKFVKLGHVAFEICERRNRETNRQTY